MSEALESSCGLLAAGLRLDVGSETFEVLELSAYRFRVSGELVTPADEEWLAGILCLDEDVSASLRVKFRTQRIVEGTTECWFHDLSLDDRKRVESWARRWEKGAHGDSFHEMTYDELARGGLPSARQRGGKSRADVESSPVESRRSLALSLVALLLVAGTVVSLFIVLVLIRQRYSIAVGNGALTGNYLPISTRVEGEVRELLVREGDVVRAGAPLVRVANEGVETATEVAELRLEAARAEVKALRHRLESYARKQQVVVRDMESQLAAERATVQRIEQEYRTARRRAERMAALRDKGAAKGWEVEEAQLGAAALEAELASKRALVRGLENRIAAAGKGIFIGNGRVVDTLDEIRAKLSIAEAVVRQRARELELARQQHRELILTAPCDGVVFAVYRRQGEFLKRAEDVMAIGVGGEAWASGTVSPGEATLVRPGQHVKVWIPSRKRLATGRVAAVGHRAVYGKGGYSADFRAGQGEVPVKVLLADLSDRVEPGTRLEMTIQRDTGYAWLNWLIGHTDPPAAGPEVTLQRVPSETHR